MASRTSGETKALLIYHNHRAILEELSDNARGKLMMALLDYSETGALPAFTGPLRMAFVVLREDVDRSSRRWEEECRRRSEAGKKSAALRAAKNFDQNVSCERDLSAEELEESEAAVCSADLDAAGERAAVLPDAEEQATAFNRVAQCSTAFNGVEHCSTAFNGVEERSAVSTNKNQNKNQNKNRNQNQNKNVKENTLARSAGAAGVRAGEFEQFWSAYPRKVGKLAARRAFERADATLDQMLEALARQRADPLWSRENGRYIPYPAAWLEQGRWADEPTEAERGYLRHGAPLGPEMQALVLRSIARMDEREQLTMDG